MYKRQGLYYAMWRQQIGEREPWAMPKATASVSEEAAVLDEALAPEA